MNNNWKQIRNEKLVPSKLQGKHFVPKKEVQGTLQLMTLKLHWIQ